MKGDIASYNTPK